MSKTQRLTRMALLAAVSIVCILLIQIPIIPAAPFLKYDMADVPILMGAFMLGPLAGIEILVAVSAIQAFFMGGDGYYRPADACHRLRNFNWCGLPNL